MVGTPPQPGSTARWRRVALLAAVVLAWVAVALALGWGFPNPTPHYDDYYHLLAARSLLHRGDLALTDGGAPYERAWLFTYAVAGAQRLLGETMFAARLPSALSFALLVGGVFLWVQRRVGTASASVSAGLLLLALHPLNYAASVRFYSSHSAAVFLFGVATFEAVAALRDRGGVATRRGVLWAVTAVAAWLLAMHLQVSTLLPTAAVALWLLPQVLWGWWSLAAPWRRRVAWAVASAAALGVGVFVFGGGLAWLVAVYHTPQRWAADTTNDWRFYLRWLSAWYGPLWWGVPLWLVLGWRRHRALVSLAAALVLVSIALHSGLNPKADRYALYVLPWLFVLAGVGLAEGLRVLSDAAVGESERLGHIPPRRRPLIRAVVAAVLVAAVGYGAWRVPELYRVLQMEQGNVRHSPFLRSDWSSAAPLLRLRAQHADIVISSAGLRSLYYLGRLDAALSVQGATSAQAGDVRTRLRITPVSDVEQLAALRQQYGRGLVTVDQEHWRRAAFVDDAEADWLEARLTELPLPGPWRMRVFVWGPGDSPMADNTPAPRAAGALPPPAPSETLSAPGLRPAASGVPTRPR